MHVMQPWPYRHGDDDSVATARQEAEVIHSNPARLESASSLLREALAILDEQGLNVAAAHLDEVIHLVDEASRRDRQLERS